MGPRALLVPAVMLTVSGVVAHPLRAAEIDIDPNFTFTGTPPVGAAPWLQIGVADTAAPGTVQVTVTAVDLQGSENVSGLYLNTDPALDSELASLKFSYVSGVDPTSFSAAPDGFKADGDGKYDLLLGFGTGVSGLMGGAGNNQSVFDLSAPGLMATSFEFVSSKGGGTGQYYAAAQVQNTGGSGISGWIGAQSFSVVPLPGAAWLLLSGIAALGVFRRSLVTR